MFSNASQVQLEKVSKKQGVFKHISGTIRKGKQWTEGIHQASRQVTIGTCFWISLWNRWSATHARSSAYSSFAKSPFPFFQYFDALIHAFTCKNLLDCFRRAIHSWMGSILMTLTALILWIIFPKMIWPPPSVKQPFCGNMFCVLRLIIILLVQSED